MRVCSSASASAYDRAMCAVADVDARTTTGSLVDRRVETHRLAAFLADTRRSGAALVVTGAPGHGKTALLEEAGLMAASRGMRVLKVDVPSGVEASDGLALLSTGLGRQPRAVRNPDDRLAAGNELLRELGVASADSPLLVCIDNAHRLDEDSMSVLAFVGRRLASTGTGLLAASTSDRRGVLRHRGLPELKLPPLTAEHSLELLERRAPQLAPRVAQRVVADAGGSPSALLELPSALTERERLGLDPLPAVLPLTDRLRGVNGPALDQLTAPAMELLITVAVARPGDLDSRAADAVSGGGVTIISVLQESGQAFAELERHGLIEVQADSRGIRFAAPLLRNAVIDRASRVRLRDAHWRLAALLGDRADRRTWHLAAARDDVDDETARELERLAFRARRAGKTDEAITALLRAAELSSTARARSVRLATAAQLQVSVAGDLGSATELLADAGRVHPVTDGLGSAAARAQLLLVQGGHVADCRRILETALSSPQPPLEDASAEVLGTDAAIQLLFYVCMLEARSGPWRTYDRLVRLHHPRRGPALAVIDGLLPDITRASPATLTLLDTALTEITRVAADPGQVILVSIAAFHLDRLAECRAALSTVVEQARHGSAKFLGAQAMLRLSLDDCLTGQLARATSLAEEAMALSASLGHEEQRWPFEVSLAMVAAMRGDRAAVDSLTEAMTAWAIPRGALLVEHHSAHVRCLAALGDADFESAYQQAASISPAGTLAASTTVAVWASLDLVEAAVHSGRHEEARAHVDALAQSGIERLSPRLALRVATATALTASDEMAEDAFDKALAVERVERWPFDTARVDLAYGERLRRLRKPARAQERLRRAHETFRRLGARSWTRRAADQLRAAGIPVQVEHRGTGPDLTDRDLEIAALAASGLSNREIGERLFLSPRTIGSRLYRIFPKLGVASRAALRDALEEQGLHAEGDDPER